MIWFKDIMPIATGTARFFEHQILRGLEKILSPYLLQARSLLLIQETLLK